MTDTRSGLPKGENADTYGKEAGVVEDTEYERLGRRGMEEFKPEDPKAAQPTRRDMPDLRESTKKVPEGAYEEDESLMGEGAPRTLGPEKETDTQRQEIAYVAASHRSGRTPEEKRQSAEKASKIEEELGAGPLEINDQGEVVTEK